MTKKNNFGKIKTVALVAVMVATAGGLGLAPLVAHATSTTTPNEQAMKALKGTKNKAATHATMGTVLLLTVI